MAAMALSACGSEEAPKAAIGHGSSTRGCDGVVFDGPGPPDWRRDSDWIGPFGLAGGAHGPDFSIGSFTDGRLEIKTPTLVAGHRPVTISLPRDELGRAGILALDSERAYTSVTYVPCEDKPRTVFPAGFVLRDRRPVTLLVEVGDGPARKLVVGAPDFVSVREAVVQGALRDFRRGTEVGPTRFDRCLAAGLRRSLTRERLEVLASVHDRRYGGPYTVQSLARLAVPVGDACGGRQYVPELIFAAHALAKSGLSAPAARRLGIEYGPYLGITCPNVDPRRAVPTACDGVGIDVVLDRPAAGVSATVGGRRLALKTPGLHSGERGRDWVGYLGRVGLERPGSPFELPGRAEGHWSGYPPLYLPVRLAVEYRGGGEGGAHLPRVFLSPGWG
jgi:hypothetical protein